MRENRPKNRWLLQTLLLSVLFNVVLVALLALAFFSQSKVCDFFPMRDESAHPPLTFKECQEMDFEELVDLLGNPQKRVAALGALVACHHFDLRRALGGRNVSYTSLGDAEFDQIAAFAQSEVWPLTSEGLFCTLKARGAASESSLLQAFCITPEFRSVERLFSGEEVKKSTLLALLYEGSWEMLTTYFENQRRGPCDFSAEMREKFLLDYLASGSKTAKRLLAGRTSDLGPRPGLKNLRPLFRDQPPAAPSPQVHIIEPGESLWLISRKYGVPVEMLMEINHLQSTTIQPGKTLKIRP